MADFTSRIKSFLAYPVSREIKGSAVEAKQAAGDHFDTHGFHTIFGDNQHQEVFDLKKEAITAIALRLSEFDAVGSQIILTPLSAIVSAGITITAEEPEVQSLIDEFWINPQYPHAGFNNTFLTNVSTSLSKNLMAVGSLYLPVDVNPVDGFVTVGYINPFNVIKVELDKGNPLIAKTLHLQPEPGKQNGRKLDIIRVQRGPTGFFMDGEAFVFTINRIPNTGIGNSELARLHNNISSFSKTMFGEGMRAALLRTFLWDVTVQNMNPGQIKKWVNDNFPDGSKPTPSMLNVHSDKVSWDIKTPKLNQQDFSTLIDRMFFQIISGTGLPSFWLGHHGNTTNATAKEMAQVGIWTVGRIQKTLNNTLTSIISFVVRQAAAHNRIINGVQINERTNLAFNVIFGKVRGVDSDVAAETLEKMLLFLDDSIKKGFISEKDSRKIYTDTVNKTLDTRLSTDDIDELLNREIVDKNENEVITKLQKLANNIITNGKSLKQG